MPTVGALLLVAIDRSLRSVDVSTRCGTSIASAFAIIRVDRPQTRQVRCVGEQPSRPTVTEKSALGRHLHSAAEGF